MATDQYRPEGRISTLDSKNDLKKFRSNFDDIKWTPRHKLKDLPSSKSTSGKKVVVRSSLA